MKNILFHQQSQFTRSFKKKLNEKLSEAGLFYTQFLVMYYINQQQPVSLVEISNYLDVEKPTITRTVKRLEEQDYIEEVPSSDKREKRLRLTEKGENSYQKGQGIVTRFESELLKGITEKDIETTLNLIHYLNEKIHKGEIN